MQLNFKSVGACVPV